jgi:hypothetical protein
VSTKQDVGRKLMASTCTCIMSAVRALVKLWNPVLRDHLLMSMWLKPTSVVDPSHVRSLLLNLFRRCISLARKSILALYYYLSELRRLLRPCSSHKHDLGTRNYSPTESQYGPRPICASREPETISRMNAPTLTVLHGTHHDNPSSSTFADSIISFDPAVITLSSPEAYPLRNLTAHASINNVAEGSAALPHHQELSPNRSASNIAHAFRHRASPASSRISVNRRRPGSQKSGRHRPISLLNHSQQALVIVSMLQ